MDLRYGIPFIMFVLLSCSKNTVDTTMPSDLQGQWIEVKTKSDTLTFVSWDNRDVMTLARGKEMRDGHLLPKKGSGPYEYTLKEGKISLYWMLSSNFSFVEYAFSRKGNRITVDNFFDPTLDPVLVFEKVD